MSALLFLVVVSAGYFTAWAWAVMATDAWRRRHYGGLAAVLLAGGTTAVLVLHGPLG